MKTRLSAVALVPMFVLTVFSGLACQSKAEVSVPDYSKWGVERTIAMDLIHNGQRVSLQRMTYINPSGLEGINLLNDESQEPWLLFYFRDNGPGKAAEFYIFEYKNNAWVLVKTLEDNDNIIKDTVDFLKDKYNIEFVSQ